MAAHHCMMWPLRRYRDAIDILRACSLSLHFIVTIMDGEGQSLWLQSSLLCQRCVWACSARRSTR